MARLIRGVQDLVVEDGEVKGETKADWVGRCKVGLGNFSGVLVSFEGLVRGLLSLVANGELSEITVIVSLPVNSLAPGLRRVTESTYILW